MKKILLVMLCALTICTLFIIPASAAGGYTTEVIEGMGYFDFELPKGTYTFVFEDANGIVHTARTCVIADYDMCAYFTLDCGYDFELCIYDGRTSVNFMFDSPPAGFLEVVPEGKDSFVGASIWDVLTGAGNYIAESLNSATALFYNAEAATLTPVGTLSLVAVAIGLAILIVALLRNFLHLS